MTLRDVIKTSRPHFWMYEGATFALIGVLAGASSITQLLSPLVLLFTFYFLIPANILIYGINDIYDYGTDLLNPKKVSYEGLITPEKRKSLYTWIVLSTLPFLFFVPLHTPTLISFILFMFFAVFYSAKPIRAKGIPFLDSFFSAGHYVATGVFGYYLAGGIGIPTAGIIAGMLWAMAMHAYSAVPDIQADTKAGINTIATTLTKKGTLFLCLCLFGISAFVISGTFQTIASIGALTYGILMYKSFDTTDEKLFSLYTYFPYINASIGALISISLIARLVL